MSLSKQSLRVMFLVVLVFGMLVHLYSADIHRFAFQLRHSLLDSLAFKDTSCTAARVIKACEKEDVVKVLFVVETVLGNRSNRKFARHAYAKRSFARPIHWLTVFNLVGNVTDENGELAAEARSECTLFGDTVVLRKNGTAEFLKPGNSDDTSSYLQFVPWILDNCPHVDLVVFMQDNIIPHPFYLLNYRVHHMDHKPGAIHCHSVSTSPSTDFCRPWSVLIAKMPGLKLLARESLVQEGQINLNGLEGRDIASYVSVDDNMTAFYTFGAVIFYALPPGLDVSMMSLWKEMMHAPENIPAYLTL